MGLQYFVKTPGVYKINYIIHKRGGIGRQVNKNKNYSY